MSSMKDILINFKKELACTYRAQKNIIDVTEKYLAQLEDAETGGSGGIDYSTEEQDTGIKWYDGRTIYQRTYEFTDAISVASGTPTNTTVSANGIDLVVNVVCYTATGTCFPNLGANCDQTYIQLISPRQTATSVKIMTLQYVKTA